MKNNNQLYYSLAPSRGKGARRAEKGSFLFFLLAVLFGFTSCSDSEEGEYLLTNTIKIVSQNVSDMPVQASEGTIVVDAPSAIDVIASTDWFTTSVSGKTITVKTTDNTGFEYACSIDNNVVNIDIQEQMTVLAGDIETELRLMNGSEILGTANFILRVEKSALDDGVVISETDIPLLEEAEANALRAENAASRAESVLASAVKSVNSITPDSSGNVEIAIPDISNKMNLVSSPTNNNILLTNASGQAIDSGKKISDYCYQAGDTLTIASNKNVIATGTIATAQSQSGRTASEKLNRAKNKRILSAGESFSTGNFFEWRERDNPSERFFKPAIKPADGEASITEASFASVFSSNIEGVRESAITRPSFITTSRSAKSASSRL